jgi:hypothetical protein
MMKKKALSLVFITGMIFSCLSEGPAAQDDTKEKIAKVTNTLTGQTDTPVTMEIIVDSLLELMDLSAAITPDNQYKEEIVSRIGVAKDLIKDGSIFDDKARQYLSFAYRMMTNGKKFEMPKDLEEFVTPAELQEKSLKYMKSLAARCLQSYEDGDKQETAKLLLEIVLATITPHPG